MTDPDGSGVDGLDLNRVVVETLGALRARLKGTPLRTGFCSGLPAVRADRRGLEEKFIETALAVRRACPDAGGLLVTTGRADLGVCLRVESFDKGQGVTLTFPVA